MEKKTVWTLVLVFAVGLIFGSLAGNNDQLTGQAQGLGLGNPSAPANAVISVDPDTVNTAGSIKITVIPGKNGIESSDGSIKIHFVNAIGSLGARTDRAWLCRKETCYDPGTVDFKVPGHWSPGWYSAVVSDKRTGEKTRADFRVL